MQNAKTTRSLACLITVIIAMFMFIGVTAYGADSDFPLVLNISGSIYEFATHGSSADGNWITLSGGTDITLPQISLIYSGASGANYSKTNEVGVVTDSSFIGDSVIYPHDTHQVFKAGDTVTYVLNGRSSQSGDNVDFRLITVNSIQDWVDAASDLFEGVNTQFETLIGTYLDVGGGALNATGDFETSFGPIFLSGDYILLAIDDTGPTTEIYSATIVEVLDGPLETTVPVSKIRRGNDLDVSLSLTSGGTGTHVFAAVMVKESAYKANAQMVSDGSIATTDVKVNGAVVIDGGATQFSLFGGGLSGFSKSMLTDFMGQAFSSSEYSVALSSSTAATSMDLTLSTDGLSGGDYVILTGVWDYSASINAGDRVLGFNQSSVYVEVPIFLPPIVPPEEIPTQEEFDALSTEEQAEVIAGLELEDAVALLEGASTEDAAQILEKLDDETAAELLAAMDPAKAQAIIDATQTEAASKILTKTSIQKAAQVMTQIQTTKAAQIIEKMSIGTAKNIVENAVSTGQKTQMAAILNAANKETAGDILLDLEAGTGAQIIREMATQSMTSAAERVEAAVKRQLQTLDPGQKQAYRQKLKETLENPELTVDDLVDLFVEIANLPETPSTVAEIFNIIDLSKVVEVVDGMVAKSKESEVAEVFSFLTPEKLTEVYTALTAATRTALYPYFNVETLGMLPQLGEFTVKSLTVSDETVEPGEVVTITAVIENIGDDTDSTTVSVTVDGVEIDEEFLITLDSGEEISLEWDVSKTAEGTYTVDVMGETTTFTVEAPLEPAEFVLSNLQVSPSTVEPGEDVTVSFTVRNTGELFGEYSIDVTLDGSVVDTLSSTLNPGGSDSLTTTVSSETEGTHTVAVDGLDAEFNVETPPSEFPTMTVIAAVVIIVVIAAGYMYMQRQKL